MRGFSVETAMPRLCVTGAETGAEALRARVAEVMSQEPRAICELRLDALSLNPEDALAFLESLPRDWAPRLLLTMRHRESGPWAAGGCDWELGSWREWWEIATRLRPWFAVDLDWFSHEAIWESAAKAPRASGEGASRIFFSYHGSIEELESVAPRLLSRAAALGYGAKFAVP